MKNYPERMANSDGHTGGDSVGRKESKRREEEDKRHLGGKIHQRKGLLCRKTPPIFLETGMERGSLKGKGKKRKNRMLSAVDQGQPSPLRYAGEFG